METLDTLTSISDSDATLISDEAQVIDKLNLVIREVHDQIGITENLSDVLTSGLDFLQSIYNNKLQDKNNLLSEKNNTLQGYNNQLTSQNNRLSIVNNKITLLGGLLPIIGAGFVVPNTISTVLSQTNIFQFSPSDMSWYITLILISTIVTTLFVWSWVKRTGLFPKRQEGDEENLTTNTPKEGD